MPRVHHGKVRKDHPDFGITKGQQAYWWRIKTGPASGVTYYSLTPPKASQLTRSEFRGAMCDLEDELGALAADDGLETAVGDIAQQFRDLGEEQRSKFENMPDGLQQGETGQLLEQRADRCDEIADELEGIDFSKDEGKDEGKDEAAAQSEDEDADDYWQGKLDEVQAVDLTID